MTLIQSPLSMKPFWTTRFRSLPLTSKRIRQSNFRATHSPTLLSRPLVSLSPVLWLQSFSVFFCSFVFAETDDFVRPFLGSPDQQDDAPQPFATQLDLDFNEHALPPVSSSFAGTLVDEDLIDHSQSLSFAAADALGGVFPVHSGAVEATSTQFDPVHHSLCQDQSLCPPST